MSIAARIDELARRGWLRPATAERLLRQEAPLPPDVADRMIENVIAVFGLPLAVAPNFIVNGREHVAPMVVEEPSIVAGVSGAAKLARDGGGFTATATDPLSIGQVHLVGVADPHAAVDALLAAKEELLALADSLQPNMRARGGGARDIECFERALPDGSASVVLHLLVDTRDAMGANLVNSMCEGIAPRVEEIAAGSALLRILSNFADRSIVTARVRIPLSSLGDEVHSAELVRDGIVLATAIADADPYRAVTHNKGVMNGIDAVALATGNDWRAIEAAAHAWAARDGTYRSLTAWSVDPQGNLAGGFSMPLKVGIVGGSLLANPAVATALEIAGVASAVELAELMAAVGLAQNLAALRALVTDGIQEGHMRLHARSVAASVGTPPELFEPLVEELVAGGDIKARVATRLLNRMRGGGAPAEPAVATFHGTASGKVILLGEHAAVYGRHALALPLPEAVGVFLRETERPTRLLFADDEEHFAGSGDVTGGAMELLSYVMERLGLQGRSFEVRLRSRIPAAMGLGSSAAVAVALLRAFNDVLGLALDDAAINELAFDCEKLAHGSPSGIDNTLATYGRPVLYRKDATRPIAFIDLQETPPLVIAASGLRGITKDQVAGVRARYERNADRYNAIFDEIGEISVAGAEALASCEYGVLGALMNICHGLLNALQVSVPELERMVDIARSAGAAGAKLTGAGGGGSIVALCPGRAADVERALRSAGYRIVPMAPLS
jgi:hydroxymethylglutaryl-CoA reductase